MTSRGEKMQTDLLMQTVLLMQTALLTQTALLMQTTLVEVSNPEKNFHGKKITVRHWTSMRVHNEKSVRQGMSRTSGERNSIHIRK